MIRLKQFRIKPYFYLSRVLKRLTTFPGWAVLAVAIGGLFMMAVVLLHRDKLSVSQVNASTLQPTSEALPTPELGKRLQLTYEQWVALLKQEAKVAAEERPQRLTVLAGDSISLWFPSELLPTEVNWLNQGISGETSAGLLQRLDLFDETQPETVLVMIGINDLIRGFREETLLANYREIIRHLKAAHPHSKIVVQSILPHAGSRFVDQLRHADNESANKSSLPKPWVVRLAKFSNQQVHHLNQEIAAIAKEEKVDYLDLYPYFTDSKGDLRAELSTDGLHLSVEGYEVWQAHLPDFRHPVVKSSEQEKIEFKTSR